MKQKAVLNISLHLKKKFPFFFSAKLTTYSKALEIAAGFEGVQSVAWQEKDNSKLELTGEDIDLILLVKKLKKKIGHTRIITVEEKKDEKKVDDDKKKDDDDKKKVDKGEVCYPVGWVPQYQYLCDDYYNNRGFCTVL